MEMWVMPVCEKIAGMGCIFIFQININSEMLLILTLNFLFIKESWININLSWFPQIILNATTVSNIDDNKKCFSGSKSSY